MVRRDFFKVLQCVKLEKKTAKKVAGWVTTHLSHDTMDCIVTQG